MASGMGMKLGEDKDRDRLRPEWKSLKMLPLRIPAASPINKSSASTRRAAFISKTGFSKISIIV